MSTIAVDFSQVVSLEAKQVSALHAAKASAHARLLAEVTAARQALITSLPGQDMIYLAKEAEAAAWVSEVDPDPAEFPLLSAEVGITAPDADQLAQLWLNMAAIWREAAAGLEAWRISAMAAIEAAETPEDAASAIARV